MKLSWLTLILFAALSPMSQGQRLSDKVLPSHYALHLTPDLQSATFAGTESIDVQLESPSAVVTLNSLELNITHVSAKAGDAFVQGKVSYDPAKQQADLIFPTALPANVPVQLQMEYTGVLNNQLRGFYLSQTAKRRYAVTQFEPLDARRAFPSFDEPAFKATFDIALTVDAADTVISNGMLVSDVPANAGKHTLSFATTPRMSTYLVAFQVGDFKCIHGSSDGVAIGVCATPDKLPLLSTALSDAEHFLHYYDEYFGIKYPLPKLDMVAIPDFEAGAMENFGCITYRETALLLDEQHASVEERKGVARVIAHEMAHQWFGDLVTMRWWDNLWLNEGFATWMAAKALEEWHPDWQVAEDRALVLNDVLNIDAKPTTRAVQSAADTPAQINQQFDDLSYGKAGAILSMVENYVGQETFRRGVGAYLRAHLYANASAENFWSVQTETSSRPIDRVMKGFVTQPGVPLLRFVGPTDGRMEIDQARFFLQSPPQPQSWVVPVCGSSMCQLAEGSKSSIAVNGAEWLNSGYHGYFRSSYDPPTLHAIMATVATKLTAPERIGFYGDEWAQVRAGNAPVSDMLTLAERLAADGNADVLAEVQGTLTAVRNRIATGEERPLLLAWERKTYGPVYMALPAEKKGESNDLNELRTELFYILGTASDANVLRASNGLAESFLEGKHLATLDQESVAVSFAAMHGDAALFDRLQQFYEKASEPQSKSVALFALSSFTDHHLVERALQFAVSGRVPKQDSVSLLSALLNDPTTRDQTWAFVKTNWPAVSDQFTISSGTYLVSAASGFCSTAERTDVADFFAAHPVPATERALQRTLDNIAGCVRLRELQHADLAQWLQTH